MEERKKISFGFIKDNFSIIKENFLIAEVGVTKYIGKLGNITDDCFTLEEVRRFESAIKETCPHLTFYVSSTDIFLPTSADIQNLGREILKEYRSIIDNTIFKPHMVFLEEIIEKIDEKERNEKLVKKFNDFCNEYDIDEKDVWVYLNAKSEKERW